MSRLGRPAAVLVAAATVLVLLVQEGGTAERHAAGADRGSPVAAAPANDELAGALLVREVPTTIRASGSGATRGAGDPACASGSHTLWYRLRPAAGGRFVATLRASTGEVCVLVRDGAGLREISQIVGEPDLGDPQSGAFGAEEGTTYYIFVGLEFSDPRYARFTLTVEPATAFVPTWPNDVAVGADGALWFTSSHGRASIGRATASGGVKRHFAPALRAPGALTVGRDGALWFTDVRSVGRISTDGAITMHSDKRLAGPVAITAGEDGFVWFTDYDVGRGEGGVVGRIDASGLIRLHRDPRIAAPEGITRGPDGAVWFTNAASGSIGRIDSAGRISFFTDPRIVAPGPITSGPDGALWFTMVGDRDTPPAIGRLTVRGALRLFRAPSLQWPFDITAGRDGALWFTNFSGRSVGRISVAGRIRTYTGPSIDEPGHITAGLDGTIWFTDGNGSIGRITRAGVVSGFPPARR